MLPSTISLLWTRAGEMNVVVLRRWVFRAVTNKSIEEFDRNVSGEDTAGSMAKFSFLNIQISKPLCFSFFLERDEVGSTVRRPLHSSIAHLPPITLSGTS